MNANDENGSSPTITTMSPPPPTPQVCLPSRIHHAHTRAVPGGQVQRCGRGCLHRLCTREVQRCGHPTQPLHHRLPSRVLLPQRHREPCALRCGALWCHRCPGDLCMHGRVSDRHLLCERCCEPRAVPSRWVVATVHRACGMHVACTFTRSVLVMWLQGGSAAVWAPRVQRVQVPVEQATCVGLDP